MTRALESTLLRGTEGTTFRALESYTPANAPTLAATYASGGRDFYAVTWTLPWAVAPGDTLFIVGTTRTSSAFVPFDSDGNTYTVVQTIGPDPFPGDGGKIWRVDVATANPALVINTGIALGTNTNQYWRQATFKVLNAPTTGITFDVAINGPYAPAISAPTSSVEAPADGTLALSAVLSIGQPWSMTAPTQVNYWDETYLPDTQSAGAVVMGAATLNAGQTVTNTATSTDIDATSSHSVVMTLPAVVVPPTVPVITETFTGTNGAPWPMTNWSSLSNNGTRETIQNNKGQVVTGTAAFDQELLWLNKGPDDFYLTFDLSIADNTNGGYFQIQYRKNTVGGGGFPGGVLELEMGGGYLAVGSLGAGNTSVTPPAFLAGDVIHWKVRVDGPVHQVKLWINDAPEPSAWTLDALDTAPTKLLGAGEMVLVAKAAGAGGATTYTLDNIVLYDTPDPVIGPPPTGPWTPASLPGLIGWWDVSALSSVAFHSGSPTGPISQVNDLSGANRHLVQATAGNAPSRDATINGLAVARVVSPNDWLDAVFASPLAQPITVAAVFHVAASASAPSLYDNTSPGTPFGVWQNGSTSTIYQETSNVISATPVAGPFDSVLYSTYNGASSSLRINGVTVASGDLGTDTMRGLRVLANRDAVASVNSAAFGEVVVCSGVLSSTDRDLLETYLMTKWTPTAGPAALYSDDFNRANGALVAPWVHIDGVHSIVSNKVSVGTLSPTVSYYDRTFGADQWVEADMTNFGDGAITTLTLRVNGGNFYYFWMNNDREIEIIKRVGGSYLGVAAALGGARAPTGPFTARLEAQGTTLRAYIDGVLVLTGTDSDIATGRAGIISAGAGASALDNWRGGDLPYVPIVYSDDFNRTDGAIGGNWIATSSGHTISTNRVTSPSNQGPVSRYNATVPADQWAEMDVTFAGSAAGGSFGPSTRGSGAAGADSMYYAWLYINAGTVTLALIRKTGGTTFDFIASTTTGLAGLTSGKVRLESEGTTHRLYVDGALKITHVDANFAAGAIGVTSYWTDVQVFGDNWRGGALPYTPAPFVGFRTFDGSNCILLSPDPGDQNDVWTMAAVGRRSAETGFTGYYGNGVTATQSERLYGYFSNKRQETDTGNGFAFGTTTTEVAIADGWVIVGCNKAAGTSVPIRFHRSIAPWSTTTHETPATPVSFGPMGDYHVLGGAGYTPWLGVDGWKGDLAVVAFWNRELSDAEFATLGGGLATWAALSPVHLWRLDQDTITDLIGNADQTSIVGTTPPISGSLSPFPT